MQASNKYKQVIFIIGTTACGKTTVSENFRYLYNADIIHMDSFYDFAGVVYDRQDYSQLTLQEEQDKYPDINEWKARWLRYMLRMVLKSPARTLVVEGSTLHKAKERDIVMSLVNAPNIVLLLEPWNWELLYSTKHGLRADRNMLEGFKKGVEGDYVLINNLGELTQPLVYQRVGFTDKKWEALKMGCVYGKSLLDLGCSTGWFNMYATSDGVGRYVGVDNQWKQIIKARSDHYGEYILGDIEEYLDTTKDTFDEVIMASTLHYFDDKEGIIKKIAKITDGCFTLEIPIHKTQEEEDEFAQYPVEGQAYVIPTQKLVLRWMGKHFKRVEVVGESVPPDGSYRLVFKGWKK